MAQLRELARRAAEVVLDWAPLAVVLAIVAGALLLFHRLLVGAGLSSGWGQSLLAWWLLGVPCALFWPLRFRSGMRGLWRKTAPQIAALTLAGPLALLLGYPL
jgi:hypothetical protein